ncbi:MAG: hypothetical protein HGB04_02110 [Chlorobiaceae bacterium]|nr:hypothetical protein [Chlorobiaceae bacterium]
MKQEDQSVLNEEKRQEAVNAFRRLRQQYETSGKSERMKLDARLKADFARLRAATPEPRVCVYGMYRSVPFIDPVAAERYNRRGGARI